MPEFERQFDRLAESARERFEREGCHDHLIYLFGPSTNAADFHEVPFGALIHAMPGGDRNSKKERAYRAVAAMMARLRLPGYIEVGEFWIASFRGDDQEVLGQYRRIIKAHGSLEQMPGREEWLMVYGCRGREARGHHWRIGRRGKEVWLERGEDGRTLEGAVWKSAVLQRTSRELSENGDE